MTHRGPFQPLPFCDSVKITKKKISFAKNEGGFPEGKSDVEINFVF